MPDNSVLFTQLVLIAVTIRALHEPLNMFYMSLGKIKRMMIIETLIMIGTLIVAYLILKLVGSITSIFITMIMMEFVIIISLIINIKSEIEIEIKVYFTKVIKPVAILSIIVIPIVLIGLFFLQFDSAVLTLLFFGIYAILTCGIVCLNMDEQEKLLVEKVLKKK